ncbi:hypothetical protein [Kribbella sp. NPDC048928]|uniref:hypothetical protein n=1 Tax=Kribbella sp. NPDC048928 TaxID=3364111 RepID=UPI0037105100
MAGTPAGEPATTIQAVMAATKFADLLAATNGLKNLAQEEVNTTGATLQREGPLWTQTGSAIGTLANSFHRAVGDLMPGWTSKREAPIFESSSSATQNALVSSAASIDGTAAGGPSAAGGTIEQVCADTCTFMAANLQLATDAVAKVEQAQAAFAEKSSTSQGVIGTEKASAQSAADPAAEEAAAVRLAVELVMPAARALNAQNAAYASVGQQILAAAQGLTWVGPNGKLDAPGGSPGGPSSGQQAAGGEQTGGEQAGGEQAGGEQAGGEQAGGEQAGGEQAGGEQAGGDPSGQVPGDDPSGGLPNSEFPGQVPGGGTGLAGGPASTMPTLPPPTFGSNLPVPPVTGPPVPPNLAPVAGIGGIGGGGIGGIGGGGIGGVGNIGGVGKADLGKPSGALIRGDQQIAQVAKMQPPGTPGNGQAPAQAGPGTGAGGTTGVGGAGGGGMPPMMPPMAGAAGAAGAGGGKPASGAIRPGGRERRRSGPTPGVPEGLLGKSGKPGTFQTKPARRDKEQSTTLEVLDEDLWTVETPEAAPTPTHQVRRSAH